jgi:protoporphyrinogen oxidase
MDTTMAPPGKTSLCVEMTCFDNDELLHKDPKELFALVSDQLHRAGYVTAGDITGYQFLKVPFAYPVYELSCSANLKKALNYLKKHTHLVTIGRQGLFFYNAMNSSMLLGYELGEKLGKTDQAGWAGVIGETYDARLGKYGAKV